MRKAVTLTLASTAVVAIACGKGKSPTSTAMTADLRHDLQLAAATQSISINPDEISPASKQELAVRPKSAPGGPKVIRGNRPTAKASALPVEVAEAKSEVPQVQVLASSPAPSETPAPDSPPLARPAPVPADNYPSTGSFPASGDGPNRGGGNTGHGGIGGGIGGIFGGIFGGDDDHCDPRPRPRGGRPIGGDNGGGIYGRPTGMPGTRPIGGRFPIVVIGGRSR